MLHRWWPKQTVVLPALWGQIGGAESCLLRKWGDRLQTHGPWMVVVAN